MTAAEHESEPDTGDLRLFKVKIHAIKHQFNTTPDIAPELPVYAFDEDHAIYRAIRMATSCGLEDRGVTLLDRDADDFGGYDNE